MVTQRQGRAADAHAVVAGPAGGLAEVAPRRFWRSGAPRRHVTELAPRRVGVVGTLRELIAYRWAIPYFGRVYLSRRYRRTWLGFVWVPLKPGFNMASKILIFGGVFRVTTGSVPYPIFLLIATAGWQLFAETVLWGTRSMEIGSKMLGKIEMPRLPLIFAAVFPGSIEFFTYACFAAVGLLWYLLRAHTWYLHLGVQTLLVPAGLTLLVLLGVGVGLVLSDASARMRDVRYAMHFGLNFMYLATPVLYPLSQIQPSWRPVAELNPVTGALEMVKDGVFDSHELTWSASLVAVGGTVALWAVGLYLLHRSQSRRRAAA